MLRARFSTWLGRTQHCANSLGLGPEHPGLSLPYYTKTSRLQSFTTLQAWNRQQAASHIRTAKNSGLWVTMTQITCKRSASFNTSAWMASRNLKTPFMDAELMESPNTCRKYNHQLGSLNYNLVQVKVHQHRQTGILNLFCGFPVCRVSGKVCEHLWICSENHAVPKHPGELLHQ